MRLESFTVHHFGHFEEITLAFGAAPAITVVRGPNEAGKTTLLHALRYLFHGIEGEYQFAFEGRDIALSADVIDASGERVRVTRRKSRKNALELMRGSDAIEPGRFERHFSGIGRKLYESVFGFRHEDLAAGAKGLVGANLGELLAGTALGADGTRLRDALARLDARRDAIYRPKAHQTEIRKLLVEHKDLRERLRESVLSATAYDELARREATAREAFTALDASTESLDEQRLHLETLVSVFADVREAERVRSLRADTALATPCSLAQAERIVELGADLLRSRAEMAAAEAEVSAARARVAAIPVDDRALSRAATAEQLFVRSQEIPQMRAQIVALAAETVSARARIASDLLDIASQHSVDAVASLRVSRTHRERLAALAQETADALHHLDKQQRTVGDRAAALEALRQRAPDVAARADDAAIATLADALDEITEAESRLAQLRSRSADLVQHGRRLRSQLVPPIADDVVANALATPSAERVRELRDENVRIESERAATRKQLHEIEVEIDERSRRRASVLAGGAVPTHDALQAARDLRDRLWTHLRGKWLHGEQPSAEISELLAGETLETAFDRSVRAADAAADGLHREAARAATIAALEMDLAEYEARGDGARRRSVALDIEQAAWAAKWREAWMPSGVAPAEPTTMSTWLENVNQLRASEVQLASVQSELHALEDEVSRWETAARAIVSVTRETPGAARRELQKRAGDVKQRSALRDQLLRETRDAETLVAKAHKALANAEADVARIASQRAEQLAALELPEGLSANEALARIDARTELARSARSLVENERTLGAHRAIVEQFDRDVVSLASELDVEQDGRTREALAESMHRDAARARDHDVARRAETESLARLEAASRAVSARLEHTLASLGGLRDAVGCADDAALNEHALRARERARLDAESARIETALARRIGEGDARAAIERELATTGEEALRSEQSRVASELAACKRQRDDALRELNTAEDERRRLGGDAAPRTEFELANVRAEIADRAEQYVIHATAASVLRNVIDRFVRDEQPAILLAASELFARLTAGRYGRVFHPLDGQDILVARTGGESLEAEQLSTGTREQLFLALRLAYVMEHCARAEPLPVIVDDAFVNFDPSRTRAAFDALAHVAERTQVLYFTCHDHVLELAREQLGARAIHVDLPSPTR